MTRRFARTLGAVGLATALVTACSQSVSEPRQPTPTSTTSGLTANYYSLLIHCGLRYATFDGVSWEVDPPVPDIPNTIVDPRTAGARSRDSVSGRMVRMSDTAAVFTTTQDPVGLVVHFHQWTGTPSPCA